MSADTSRVVGGGIINHVMMGQVEEAGVGVEGEEGDVEVGEVIMKMMMMMKAEVAEVVVGVGRQVAGGEEGNNQVPKVVVEERKELTPAMPHPALNHPVLILNRCREFVNHPLNLTTLMTLTKVELIYHCILLIDYSSMHKRYQRLFSSITLRHHLSSLPSSLILQHVLRLNPCK